MVKGVKEKNNPLVVDHDKVKSCVNKTVLLS